MKPVKREFSQALTNWLVGSGGVGVEVIMVHKYYNL